MDECFVGVAVCLPVNARWEGKGSDYLRCFAECHHDGRSGGRPTALLAPMWTGVVMVKQSDHKWRFLPKAATA